MLTVEMRVWSYDCRADASDNNRTTQRPYATVISTSGSMHLCTFRGISIYIRRSISKVGGCISGISKKQPGHLDIWARKPPTLLPNLFSWGLDLPQVPRVEFAMSTGVFHDFWRQLLSFLFAVSVRAVEGLFRLIRGSGHRIYLGRRDGRLSEPRWASPCQSFWMGYTDWKVYGSMYAHSLASRGKFWY